VTDGDVKHAMATGSVIIGFKTRVDKGAVNLAEAQSVTIITSKIVYDLEKAVQEFLTGGAITISGELEVLAIFNQERTDKQLVGGRVIQGTFRPKATCEIVRHPAAVVDSGSTTAATPAAASPSVANSASSSIATKQNYGAKTVLGNGRILELRERKSEITSAEVGKEVGVLVSSPSLIQVGDRLIIKK
jgi:translation initiation factor IF-2